MRTKITSNNCANQKLRTKIITKTEKCEYALILKNPAGIGINLTFVLKCHLSRVLFDVSILWERQIQFFPFCIRTPPDWVWWRCATEPRAMADPLPEFRCSTPKGTGSPLDDRLKKSKKWTLNNKTSGYPQHKTFLLTCNILLNKMHFPMQVYKG